ncbi:MAG: phosphate ABC transporter substrate-binding/OmpA family protein [Alphaproteobacteria bacterium]
MADRFLSSHRTLTAFAFLLAAAGPDLAGAEEADGRQKVLHLVAEASAGPERMIAIGVSTMANLHVAAADIAVDWVVQRGRTVESVLDESGDMALLDLSKVDLHGLDGMPDLRAVMAFWPVSDQGETADAHPGYLLVARSSVGGDVVRALLERMREDRVILKAAHVDIDRLDPAVAMADLPLPLHEAASAYRAANGDPAPTLLAAARPSDTEAALGAEILPGEAAEPGQTPIPEAALQQPQAVGRSFTLYFDSNEAKLDYQDFRSVADACRYAATLPRARFVISGHTDTVGSTAYNDWLGERRAAAVANAIRNDPRFREALSVVDYGETMLAVATDDEVAEPMNRRVEITILEDE